MAQVRVPIEDAGDVTGQDHHVGGRHLRSVEALVQTAGQDASCDPGGDGLSVAEAATRCRISESDVKVSVHRGLKALAAAVAPEQTK